MIRFIFIRMLSAFAAVLALCVPAFAASTIQMSASGNGIYQLQGVNMENAAAMDITFFYDAAALVKPRFAAGPLISGAMTAVNSNVPGIMRIAIIRTTPVTGSGNIATISFDLTGSGPGKITTLVAKLATINGPPLAAAVQINNATEISADETASAASTPVHDPVKPAVLPVTGIVSTQPDKPEEPKPASEIIGAEERNDLLLEQKPVTGQDAAARKTESDLLSSTRSTVHKDDPEMHEQESVLDRFRTYRGERTASAFIALFQVEQRNGYRQDPSLALSDGKAAVKSAVLEEPGEITPEDIKTIGARLVSLRRDPENTNRWILTFIPVRGEYLANFTILREKARHSYPLTIAPKVRIPSSKAGLVSEADFNRYLKAGKTSKTQAYDMNKDGKRDYIDDYIFTANYLMARSVKNGGKTGH